MYVGEKKLWKAVIEQAIADAMSKRLNVCDRKKAERWLCKDNVDFHAVCDFAEFDPTAVRERFRRLKNRKKVS